MAASNIALQKITYGLGAAAAVVPQNRECDDLPPTGGLAPAEVGGVLAEREVGPGSMAVRTLGDGEVHDAGALVLEHEEHVQGAKRGCGHEKEVAGGCV
jgi:hypothetical protein